MSAAAAPRPATRAAGPRGWRAWHLFYHAPLHRPLRLWVAPLCAGLAASGEVSSFYFIRYLLGGPHLRLRVLPRPGRAAAVEACVREAAASFLAGHPSPVPLADDVVHRQNRLILPHDPGGAPSAEWVVPDNTLVPAPPGFEVERYGGPGLFRASLDLFTLSSLYVLRAAGRADESTAATRLADASGAMLRLAWGLARGVDEIAALVAWAQEGHVGPLHAFVQRGDEAFERGRDAWMARVRRELVALASPDSRGVGEDGEDAPAWLGRAAGGLARELDGVEDGVRWRIAWSQLHMTANRLGLQNAEEVYLGRMLQRSLLALAESGPVFWRELGDAHQAQRAAARPALRRVTRDALAAFGAG